MAEQRVELRRSEVLVHKGFVVDREVLDAVVDSDKRLLWAFVRKDGVIRAIPYSEEEVIWMSESDIPHPDELEI